MTKAKIPVYDICSIDRTSKCNLLIERFGQYLKKHYENLHRSHRHSFYHFVLFLKGKGSHTIDFERMAVKPYQIYFMIPGQVHSWHFESDMEGYVVHFEASLFSGFLQNTQYLEQFQFFKGNSQDGVIQLPAAVHKKVVELFESMLSEILENTEQNMDMIRLLLLELFILIDRAGDAKKRKIIAPQKLTLLRNYQQLIDKHFRDIKLPKEYADLLYITPNHLNALCQDLLGKTAGDLIHERVILEAKRLLTNADMTVTQIAYNLNFQDNSYFNRFFKKEVGVTPDEFRKQFIYKSN